MSALPIDLTLVEIPAAGRQRWTYVPPSAPRPLPLRPASAPLARPAARRAPGGRPLGVCAPGVRPAPTAAAPAPGAPLRLTRRGLAVAVGGFAVLMVTALVVVVAAFLSVSNDPIVSQLPLG